MGQPVKCESTLLPPSSLDEYWGPRREYRRALSLSNDWEKGYVAHSFRALDVGYSPAQFNEALREYLDRPNANWNVVIKENIGTSDTAEFRIVTKALFKRLGSQPPVTELPFLLRLSFAKFVDGVHLRIFENDFPKELVPSIASNFDRLAEVDVDAAISLLINFVNEVVRFYPNDPVANLRGQMFRARNIRALSVAFLDSIYVSVKEKEGPWSKAYLLEATNSLSRFFIFEGESDVAWPIHARVLRSAGSTQSEVTTNVLRFLHLQQRIEVIASAGAGD